MEYEVHVSNYLYEKVEKLMLEDGTKDDWFDGEPYPTDTEWRELVVETCIDVINNRECNPSIEDAYFDLMH